MMRVAVTLAALASASAFAPISAPMGLKLRAQNVARAPRSAGERQTSGLHPRSATAVQGEAVRQRMVRCRVGLGGAIGGAGGRTGTARWLPSAAGGFRRAAVRCALTGFQMLPWIRTDTVLVLVSRACVAFLFPPCARVHCVAPPLPAAPCLLSSFLRVVALRVVLAFFSPLCAVCLSPAVGALQASLCRRPTP